MSYGLLLLRLVIGGTMFSHGAQKLFGWFGGHGLRGTAGFFESLGWRLPLVMAFLAGLAETSGLAFAAGLLTPLAALGIAVVMLNAILVVHWRNGFFNGDAGSSSRSLSPRSPSRLPRPVPDGSRSTG
jgi:putative oxidoreductase